MSSDESFAADESGSRSLVVGHTQSEYPEPVTHGVSVQNHLNDLKPSDRNTPIHERDTLYSRALRYWREHVGDAEKEPYDAATLDPAPSWLPDLSDDESYVVRVKSSGWKAGMGTGDNYSQFYQYHVMLRIRDESGGSVSYRKPPVALHVEIMPQFGELLYRSGDHLELPYGEGTRVVCWTTWADSPEDVERRMYQAISHVYGSDSVDPTADRDPDSRRIAKSEAHVRFAEDLKGAAVETVRQSKKLIAWGGRSEIETHERRAKQGWLEAVCESGRWDLLGFDDVPFDTELKIYQMSEWHKRPPSDPFRHPKLEASFAGSDRGEKLPHVDEWDDVMDHLRTVVATHCEWAGIDPSDLVADDFFDGPAAERWTYQQPTGRREHLRERYQEVQTEIYKEALKDHTTAVYDILRVVATESGATYDKLVAETGLARSTVRYHVSRLAREGVLKRLGNPVLVVYVSEDVLDRAREVLDRSRPGRTREDRLADARDRRERRESRRETDESDTSDNTDEDDEDDARAASNDSADDDDGTADDAEDDAPAGSDEWDALADVDASIRDVAVAIHGPDDLTPTDVRLRRRAVREVLEATGPPG